MKRRVVLLLAFVLFVLGVAVLQLNWRDLWPSEGGRQLAADFFSAALRPALDYEELGVGFERAPFLEKVFTAWWMTLRYALAAIGLALVTGVIGGVLASRSWWVNATMPLRVFRSALRVFATAVRSVHELLWALLFLAAVGTTPLVAVLALALPYAGTLVKVFSEILDEADQSAREVVKSSGASGLASLLCTTFVSAIPDGLSYAFYRFECAIRSSAILGFVGIPTLGYEISTAFEDGNYHEIWTYLYVLLATLLVVEALGAQLRSSLKNGAVSQKEPLAKDSVATLWKKRSRSWFLRALSVISLFALVGVWLERASWEGGVSFQQGLNNLNGFLKELVPYPVREENSWTEFWPWLSARLIGGAGEALWMTFHIATVGILLASSSGLLLSFLGARSLSQKGPRGVPMNQNAWARVVLAKLARLFAVIARSLPEFIIAFLLLQIFGPTLWALILALAIHNGGILARLCAEVVDNSRSATSELLLAKGSSRSMVFFGVLIPENFGRLLLFFCYRWETCIREATILGMLGVGSLGFLISEARARLFFDELILLTLLGGTLVFLGDLASDWLRAKLKRGGFPATPQRNTSSV